MPMVFLSYSLKDHHFAELAGLRLAEAGVKLWRDQSKGGPRISMSEITTTEEVSAKMSEQQAKRLDHLQAIISRMADNSFKLKGWCLTLVSALLGLALKTDAGAAPTSQIAFFALVPTVVFWLLDAYYLALERGFRNVYNESAKNPAVGEQGISPPKMTLGRTLNVARDPVTAALYIALLVTALVVGFGGAAKVIGWLRQLVHWG